VRWTTWNMKLGTMSWLSHRPHYTKKSKSSVRCVWKMILEQGRVAQHDYRVVFFSFFLSFWAPRRASMPGHVSADLYVQVSGGRSADFVVRLCDVHPDGSSINLCDGVARAHFVGDTPTATAHGTTDTGAHTEVQIEHTTAVSMRASRRTIHVPPYVDTSHTAANVEDTSVCVHVDMWLTANMFKRNHRIRVQVSSGQHPRFSRNLGTASGGPDESALVQETAVSSIRLFHDLDRPSCVSLPVIGPGLASHGSQATLIPRSRSQLFVTALGKASGPVFSQA